MNEHMSGASPGWSIAAVERDTGLSKDTLRVWERRYGFPQPARDAFDERLYPPEQVERLRLVRRLLDAGHRPGRVVALDLPALQALAVPAVAVATEGVARHAQAGPAVLPDVAACLALVQRHDAPGLRRQLAQAALRLGLLQFVTGLVAPLTTAVGDAWMQGRFQVFEEHLYTECVTGVLRGAIASVPAHPDAAGPRVLLTTFPGEPHAIGLLMVEALLALEGCACLSLGTQTPVPEIAAAALAHRADIVALSFTPVQGASAVLAALRELRQTLPAAVTVWAGGNCPALDRQGVVAGVLRLHALERLPEQVALWRAAAAPA